MLCKDFTLAHDPAIGLRRKTLMNNYQVYVLQNPAGLFYIGVSEDPITRVNQHNTGISKWTRNRGPWKLIWVSEGMSLSEARKLENKLKRQKGGKGFYVMTGLPKV
jgi:predicted GIY-YIG superfamily endonuclease